MLCTVNVSRLLINFCIVFYCERVGWFRCFIKFSHTNGEEAMFRSHRCGTIVDKIIHDVLLRSVRQVVLSLFRIDWQE